MQVDPNQNIGAIPGITWTKPAIPQESTAKSDEALFGNAEALDASLNRAPEVRPEAVERAKNLIADSHYPPPETIQKISHLLALNWNAQNQ